MLASGAPIWEFWSSNLLELCSVVWLSSQVVRGVVLTSGVPILVSIAIVRYVQDKIKKELSILEVNLVLFINILKVEILKGILPKISL